MTTSTGKRRAGTVLAAAAAGVMFVSGTAHADDRAVWAADESGWAIWMEDAAEPDRVYTWNSKTDDAGVAVWIENGDALRVCDHSADGHGVRGYIYRPNPGGDSANGEVLMKANDPTSGDDCVTAPGNISETISIAVKVCRYKGAWVGNCAWAVLPR